jgi:hypothetical protein
MSMHVRYAVGDVYIGLQFGGLQHITEHSGFDHVSSVDVRFQHGLLQMSSAELDVLVRQGQKLLATLPPFAVEPNCSGATADIPEVST